MKLSRFLLVVGVSSIVVLGPSWGCSSGDPDPGSGGTGGGPGATGGATSGSGGATGGSRTGGQATGGATGGSTGGRQSGSTGGSQSGGKGGGGAATGGAGPSCSAAGASSNGTFAHVKEVITFYCGGTGCHNAGQEPNLFPGNDATLYKTLTTYKVSKCGNRVLVKPCAPDESAFYRVQTEPTGCSPLPQMPFGCGQGSCTDPDDLDGVRQWIANGAPM